MKPTVPSALVAPTTSTGRGLRLALVALALVALPARAQHPQVRQGFWFNAGLGYGSLGCQDCDSREGGLSGAIAIGGTLAHGKLYLGAGTNGWTKEEQGVRLNVGTLTALIRWYPSATGGFFLLAGLGVGQVEIRVSGVGNASETGTAALIGLGYDIRVGRNVSLTPFWNGYGIQADDDVDANVGQIGLGITVH